MADTDKNSNCCKSESPADKDGASATTTGAKPEGTTGGKDNLEDFLSTLKQQMTTSDWLQTNTAEKWEQENPDLAKQYKEAMKKS